MITLKLSKSFVICLVLICTVFFLIIGNYLVLTHFEDFKAFYELKMHRCLPGYTGYGTVPLGCVSQKQADKCKTHSCPVCLSVNTLISSSDGAILVQDLKEGMMVWSVNSRGEKVISKVIKTSSTEAPSSHKVVHLKLKDGRELFVSPNHNSITGKSVSSLKVGEIYDNSEIVNNSQTSYRFPKTYDLLPDSDTGFYWANGILMGSTLK